MSFVSITRLRIRSIRFLIGFAVHTLRAQNQVRHARGFQAGALLPDRRWTFWTMTVWDSQESMRAYILNGAHKAVMPKLLNWCDEASVVHWDQPDVRLPSWQEPTGKCARVAELPKFVIPARIMPPWVSRRRAWA
jgi:hypothetical protein